MGNAASSGYQSGYEGQGVWQFGNEEGDKIVLNVWDNGDISWCHEKVTPGVDIRKSKCPCTGRVPCAWRSETANKWNVCGSGMMCGFGKVDIMLVTSPSNTLEVRVFDMPNSPYGAGDDVKFTCVMSRHNKLCGIDFFRGIPGLLPIDMN